MIHDPIEPGSGIQGLPLDHVAIAVHSIDEALPSFEAVSGASGSHRERVASQGVEVCFLGEGAGKLELLQPLGPDTPVGRFLERRGSGLHHIAYRVTGIDSTLESLAAAGFELIDRVARSGAQGHRVAFIHPRSTGGTLIELVEP